MKLTELFEVPPADFYTALSKFRRVIAGYPQEYGFHHDISSSDCRGSFVVTDGRGKVHKVQDGDVTIYRCTFDEDNLLNDHQRLHQILDAAKLSAPNMWPYHGPSIFALCDDPCFTVVGNGPRIIDIKVKHDGHEALKHY